MRNPRRDHGDLRPGLDLARATRWHILLLAVVGCGPRVPAETPPGPAAAPPANRSTAASPDQQGWLAGVRAAVAAGEYRVRPGKQSLEAVNRMQRLSARWSKGAVSVRSSTGTAPEGTIALETIGFGRRGRSSVQAGDAYHLGACGSERVKDENGQCLKLVERDLGGVVERWENGPGGLAHSFVIAQPPSEKPRNRQDWLSIDVRVSGARTVLAPGSDRAELIGKDGRRLHYAGLAAWDADRRSLPVRMRRAANGLRLEIDDASARYPLLVDPVLTARGWTVESNEVSGGSGMLVKGAGDVNNDGFDDVLVAFPNYDVGGMDAGIVYLYLGGAAGPDTTPDWSSQGADASASPVAAATAGSRFGISVAAAGDVNNDGFADVIIGQSQWSNPEANEGRAYIFHGNAGGLPANPSWVVESNQAGASFGGAVSGAGDVNGLEGAAHFADVLVSATLFDGAVVDGGRVFLYRGAAAGASTTPSDTIDGPAASIAFGGRIASAGDVNGDGRSDVIVGAPAFSNVEMLEGAAFVYLGRADGTLERTGAFSFETNQASALITSVDGVGDVNGDGYADVAISSSGYDNGEVDEGAVFFFAGSGTGLVAPPTVIESNFTGASFGITVAGPGDVNGDGYADIAVGSYRWDTGTVNNSGAVILVPGSARGPANSVALLSDTILVGAVADDNLGFALGAAGDVNGDGYSDVVAGAPGVDGPETGEGRATLYLGSSETGGLRPVNDLALETSTAGAALGTVTAAAGDVNGDGFADYAVAAPSFGGANNGTVFLYHGGPAGADATADGTLTGPAGAGFGKAVASAGDINGDGFGDLVVGAPNFGSGQADEGRIFVYRGSATGITAGSVVTFDSDSAGALLGSAVGSVDSNGDGLSDVLAGAPGLGNGQASEGRVYLFRGSYAGFIATNPVVVESDVANARLGAAVAGAGDFNRDGFGDVVAGAPGYSDGEIEEGRIYVYPGSASGLGAPIARESDQANAALGTSVDGAGDADGNGFADIVAGAPGAGGGAGAVFVFDSDMAGLTATPFSFASATAGASLGASVAGAGDLDADGIGDIVVGAPGFANGQTNEGALFVFLSGGTILPAMPALIIEGGTAELRLGASVAGAGDVNGDGTSDVVLGAPGYSVLAADAGRALLHLGNTNGRPFRLGAQRPGVATVVQPGSVVPGSMAAFDIAIRASAPQGVGNVRLETEVKPAGTAFDGTGTVLDDAFVSSGLAGLPLTRSITGLTGRSGYHYRVRIHYDPSERLLRARTSPWIFGGVLGEATGADLRTDGVALGAACTMATECGSGFCIDGVCCATTCGDGTTNDCKACSTAAGGTAGNGICTDRAVGAGCSDGNGCTATDTCQAAGVCQAGAAVVCMAMSQCHDVGVCDPGTGTCSNPVKMNGTACSDGSMCTTGETCQAGACSAGTATVCAASDQCHDAGSCDPATGTCSNPAKMNGAACSDGSMCTTGDTCQSGACTAGTPVVCTASDQCHDVGVCDSATGTCSNPAKMDGTACNDGSMCTTMDRCMAGACVMGGTLDCNDNNVCTTDTCVPASGCMSTAIVACNPNVDAGVDAAVDAATDAGSDGPDALGDARDGNPTDALAPDVPSTDARDASTDSARDGSGSDARLDAPIATDVRRDTASTMDGAGNVKRVGGGGGCDCDVGRGRSANVQLPVLVVGLGLAWMRRRRRK